MSMNPYESPKEGSSQLSDVREKTAGWCLFAIGVLSGTAMGCAAGVFFGKIAGVSKDELLFCMAFFALLGGLCGCGSGVALRSYREGKLHISSILIGHVIVSGGFLMIQHPNYAIASRCIAAVVVGLLALSVIVYLRVRSHSGAS